MQDVVLRGEPQGIPLGRLVTTTAPRDTVYQAFLFFFSLEMQLNVVKQDKRQPSMGIWTRVGRCYFCLKTLRYQNTPSFPRKVGEGPPVNISVINISLHGHYAMQQCSEDKIEGVYCLFGF